MAQVSEKSRRIVPVRKRRMIECTGKRVGLRKRV